MSLVNRALILCLLVLASGAARAEGLDDLAELSLAELLEVEVITVSRTEQKLGEVPSSVTVIPREEIRASGARSIPDLLRAFVGLEVKNTTAGNYDVGARGGAELLSNKMLVQIDGRAVNEDLYGNVLWGFLTIGIEEIQSIEIIRGPASATHGANAFSGVVNIRTIDPADAVGLSSAMHWGENESGVSAVYARRSDDVTWRVSGGALRSDERVPSSLSDRPGVTSARANGMLRFHGAEGQVTTLSSGVAIARTELLPTESSRSVDFEGANAYAHVSHASDSWRIGGYVNVADRSAESAEDRFGDVIRGLLTTTQLEIERAVDMGRGHRALFGAETRVTVTDIDSQEFDQEATVAFFANDEWRLGDRWILNAGVRVDDHPRVDTQFSPRVSILFVPFAGHALTLAGGRAYRTPTFFERSFVTDRALMNELALIYRGDPHLDPERIESVEAGWKALWTPWLITSATVYRNRVDDLIELTVFEYHPSPPAPLPGMPAVLSFQNFSAAEVEGIETEVEAKWASLGVRANYSYTNAQDAETGIRLGTVAEHRGSMTLRWYRPTSPWTTSVRALYVGETEWMAENPVIATPLGSVGDYVSLDLHVARALAGVELSATFRNALGTDVQDHPVAWSEPRSITIGMRGQFR